MEYEKNGENFSFGFGTAKAAGAGKLSAAEEAPKSVKTKYDKKAILKSAAKAAVLTSFVLLKNRVMKKRKR